MLIDLPNNHQPAINNPFDHMLTHATQASSPPRRWQTPQVHWVYYLFGLKQRIFALVGTLDALLHTHTHTNKDQNTHKHTLQKLLQYRSRFTTPSSWYKAGIVWWNGAHSLIQLVCAFGEWMKNDRCLNGGVLTLWTFRAHISIITNIRKHVVKQSQKQLYTYA